MKTFKQFVEHHQTDANGKVIEHGDGTPSSVEEDYYKGTGEKVQARTRKWMKKKGQEGAPGLDAMKARTAEHKAKRGVKEEVVDEAKQEKGRSDYGKASVRNKRKFGKEGEPAIFDASGERGKMIDQRRAEHKARRGVKEDKKWIQKADIKKGAFTKKADAAGMSVQQFAKKVVGNKDKFSSKTEKQAHLAQTFAKMEEVQPIKEDDAYKYVVSKLKKKYGSGVLTKGDKIKPQSAADKAKVRAHQAKVDAENAAERAKDPSQGRYPKRYSNRGSD